MRAEVAGRKALLVTGARGGIGRAAVRAAHDAGYSVFAHDARVAAEEADLAPHVQVLTGDLTKPSGLASLVEQLQGHNLQGVIAAHGVEGAGEVTGVTRERFDLIMEVNFRSVASLYQHMRPLLEQSQGTFVVLVSQAGLVGEARNSAYCASKFALVGWASALGSHRVPLRLLCPGCVDTPLLHDALSGMADPRRGKERSAVDARLAGIPLGRFADPSEIAVAALALAELETPNLLIFAPTGGEVLY